MRIKGGGGDKRPIMYRAEETWIHASPVSRLK